MRPHDRVQGSANLDYENPSRREPVDPALVAANRWSMFRKIRLILRIVYLVVCLGLLAFAWKYVQGYMTLLDNAGKQ